jgi:hypothetical protein
MIISVYNNSVVNNVTTQTLNRTVTTTVSNYVSGNVFTMTYNNVADMLVNNPIPQFQTAPIEDGQTANIKFTVTAVPVDKVENPQNVSQTFNFAFTPISSTTQTKPGALFKVYESNDVNLPDYNGDSYYNIKKPAGGYITYRFECSNLLTTSPPRVIALPNMTDAAIVVTNTPDTKYTNVIEVKTLGRFELKISYTSDDLKLPIPNSTTTQLITGTVTSLPFTL